MTEPSNPEEKPGEDLRTRLHAMESKVRKLRDMRNMHNDEAKRLADKLLLRVDNKAKSEVQEVTD